MPMIADLHRDGFTILPNVLSATACDRIATDIQSLMNDSQNDAIQSDRGRVVGGRNLLAIWQGWRQITRQPSVRALIADQLGQDAGIVRILYFDKPPGMGWSLSLHKDRTIAVQRHLPQAAPFAKPTRKAGVPHVEASEALLTEMITLRLHLDDMHDDNGPLIVVPGSHEARDKGGPESADRNIHVVHCAAGDVFVMRPLLSHGSRAASAETTDHRRVVHLELAPSSRLPSDYDWHQFEPTGCGAEDS